MILIKVLGLMLNKKKVDILNLLRIRLYKDIEVLFNGLNKEVRYKKYVTEAKYWLELVDIILRFYIMMNSIRIKISK